MRYSVIVNAVAESKPIVVDVKSKRKAVQVGMNHYHGGALLWNPEKPQVVVMPYSRTDAPYNRRHFLTLRVLAGRISDCRTPSAAHKEYRILQRCALNDAERKMLREKLNTTLAAIRWRKSHRGGR